ncbi:uncharacterized protein LOC125460464 [Stegostoma tigrinum]|uniref:uncharacterized protein LOC125460464 n=1 Tax=Stegostoma tigrinum TaxID=3053191 RepID=UPI00202B12A1|nr:uncharacterized protein LOC125460464 [Stegostoma tigrinum]
MHSAQAKGYLQYDLAFPMASEGERLQTDYRQTRCRTHCLLELRSAFGEGWNVALGSFPHVETNGQLNVMKTVLGYLQTSESSSSCQSLDENFTLLAEERTLVKTKEEVDQLCLQKPKKNGLPSIRKREEFAFNNKKAPQKKLPSSDHSKPQKPPPPRTAPCVKKSKHNMSNNIAPWVGISPLDTTFGAIPQSLEPLPCHTSAQHHLPCSTIRHWCGSAKSFTEDNFGGNQDGLKGIGSKAVQRLLRTAPEGTSKAEALVTQRSGKDGWSQRRLRSKQRGGTKLPPVQCISSLSFTRNFTFSFFELPHYQLQQYRARRTLMSKTIHE